MFQVRSCFAISMEYTHDYHVKRAGTNRPRPSPSEGGVCFFICLKFGVGIVESCQEAYQTYCKYGGA